MTTEERLILAEDVIAEFDVARAAWIHHVNAPRILMALWKYRRDGVQCIHSYTAPGVGAAGFQYCIFCGQESSER